MIFFFFIFGGAKGSRSRHDGRAREEAVALAMGMVCGARSERVKYPPPKDS